MELERELEHLYHAGGSVCHLAAMGHCVSLATFFSVSLAMSWHAEPSLCDMELIPGLFLRDVRGTEAVVLEWAAWPAAKPCLYCGTIYIYIYIYIYFVKKRSVCILYVCVYEHIYIYI